MLAGLDTLCEDANVAPAQIGGILHATTVATNAILERKGPRIALITTAGFRDVLIIGRQKRYDTYDMYLAKPVPLLRRRDIFEVAERTLADGSIEAPLDAAALERVLERHGGAKLRVRRRVPAARLRQPEHETAHRRAIGAAQPAARRVALL